METLVGVALDAAIFAIGLYVGTKVRGLVSPREIPVRQTGHPVIFRKPIPRRTPKVQDDKKAWDLEQKDPER